jgi:hypothetical protein
MSEDAVDVGDIRVRNGALTVGHRAGLATRPVLDTAAASDLEDDTSVLREMRERLRERLWRCLGSPEGVT